MRVGAYEVTWKARGWSGAIPVIRERRRFLGFLWWRWVRVDFEPVNSVWPYNLAYTATPNQIRDWFEIAVRQYEGYRDAWAAEQGGGA